MRKFQIDRFLFSIISYSVVCVFSLLCVIPFIMVLSGSLTNETAIFKYGYSLFPKEFSLEAYKLVLESPQKILNAYVTTIGITVVGTGAALFLTAMTGYVLQKKNFRTRNFFSLYFYFTTLFSGGLVPWYIMMHKYFHMKDNYLALILPLMLNVFYIIIIRSFFKSLPDALAESAKIDGAGEFYTFVKIILPLSKPILSTIGMFIALNYWNDWFNAMLFIQNEKMLPLQYFLYKLLCSIEFAKNAASRGANIVIDLPSESFKLAMTIITLGPIVFLYPFIQRYFIKGITIGSVKG